MRPTTRPVTRPTRRRLRGRTRIREASSAVRSGSRGIVCRSPRAARRGGRQRRFVEGAYGTRCEGALRLHRWAWQDVLDSSPHHVSGIPGFRHGSVTQASGPVVGSLHRPLHASIERAATRGARLVGSLTRIRAPSRTVRRAIRTATRRAPSSPAPRRATTGSASSPREIRDALTPATRMPDRARDDHLRHRRHPHRVGARAFEHPHLGGSLVGGPEQPAVDALA